MTNDRHVRRSGDDYAEAFAALLPRGPAWPREPDTVLMQLVGGLAQIFGYVDSRAGDLLERESDPRYTTEMFTDWERNWGLPDPCFFHGDGTGDLATRRMLLLLKMTLLGGQSRAFFVDVAKKLGYSIIIHEHAPFMVGVSSVGPWLDDAGFQRWEIGPPELRFYWSVSVA